MELTPAAGPVRCARAARGAPRVLSQDEPGERYDVYVIDYGAYVDLIHTKYAPLGLLPFTGDGGYTDVPPEDLRALRRAILDLQEFHASADGSTEVTATAATSEVSQQHLDL